MAKEHKKLYKAGKNWVVATLTATTLTLLGGIGTYTAHADTTTENNQSTETANISQTNQNDNSGNSIVLSQPVTTQSNQTDQNNQSVQQSQINQGNRSTSTTPTTETAFAATNSSDGLDPNIYGTVNVKDWDTQTENNILNIIGYHGTDNMHITIPNLNDFAKSGLNVDGVNCVGLSSTVAKELVPQRFEHDEIGEHIFPSLAISKTSGRYSNKVIATDSDWSRAFSNPYLGHADLTNLDTSNITNMSQMFASTNRLGSVEGLDEWNTSHVTNMSGMFKEASLESLNLTNWNTSKVTNMSEMFKGAIIKSVGNLTNWDTSNVTDMSSMFEEADKLETLNLSNWNTSNVNNMANMFVNAEDLKSVGDLTNWNTSKVTNMYRLFARVKNIKTAGNLSHWDIGNVTNAADMFLYSGLQTVGNLSNWNTSNIIDMSGMFAGSNFQTVGDLSNWDTHNVTNMEGMFDSSKLQTIGDLSRWDTSKVTNMSYMFVNLISPTIGDLSQWNTSNVTNMSEMFAGSNFQTVGNLSNWDTHNVTNMSNMFEETKFNTLNLSNWNTSKVTNMSSMFKNASKLQTVGDLSNWNTSHVTNMSEMFEGTSNLQAAGNLGKWDASSLVDIAPNNSSVENMFYGSKLPFFYVSGKHYMGNIYYKNQVSLIDSKGLMGQPGRTVATIITPTFYKQLNGNSEEESVIATITPLVEKEANTIYQQFRSKLTKGMQLIYPEKVSLKMVDTVYHTDALANATFDYNMKIGTLKDVVINYVDKTGGVIGNIVGSEILTGTIGSTIPLPKKLSLPSGYQLVNGQDIPTSVTVEKGKLQTIEIYVEKESESPVVQKGSINYVDPDGKVVKTDKISGKVGDKINIKVSLPDGYELANKDEQIPSFIIVTEDGIKPITINVKKVPGVQTGSINYVDQYGKVIKTDTISGKVGDRINISLSLPNGYELANNEQIPRYITVTEDGIKPITINVKEINTNLANNEVPYDSTTVFNNVNANYGNLDGYRLTENGQGQAQLIASGWHATGASSSDRYRYMIVFDNTLGREIARQKLVPQVRSDVQRAYPNVDDSLYSGFNITIDIPSSSINHSLSLISRYSSDPNNGEGARVDHWFNSLAFNEGNQANLDGMSSNGNTLTVNGWHATNQAAGRPYHYIIAWDRSLGHEIARREVTAVSRPDVANVYNTVANAVNSGFSVNFNLTPQFFNDNIQFISRWTDDAAGNGNAVDYWFKPMNRTNRANLDSVALSNGQLQVTGWHATDLSQLEPNHYLIVFDNTTGQQVASERVDLHSSQDVKNVFGDIQTADHSRFNYTFSSLHLIPGHNYSLVSRYSADATGNGNNGAHTDSWLNMGAFQQSAYSIDNVALNQRHMTVQGWLANDNAMTKPYAYAILIQNGREIGRQRLTLSERDDVAKVYPQIYRSQYSGFNANFDLPTFSTRGLQLVLRFTDDPAGNGNSSDNWINL